MKNILLAASAALMLAGPLAIAPALAQDRGDRQHQDGQQRPDGERYQKQGRADQAQDSRPEYRRDHRGRRGAWRDNRRDARWDEARHNGYYQNSRWHYGPPQADLYGRRGVTLGYKPWERGQRLGYYSNRYQEVDYRSARDYRGRSLRQPPHGYHWVRDDGGDYLLAAIAGGLIAQVILSSNRY